MPRTRRMKGDELESERPRLFIFGTKIFVYITCNHFREREVVYFLFAYDIVLSLRCRTIQKFTVLQKPDRCRGNIAGMQIVAFPSQRAGFVGMDIERVSVEDFPNDERNEFLTI